MYHRLSGLRAKLWDLGLGEIGAVDVQGKNPTGECEHRDPISVDAHEVATRMRLPRALGIPKNREVAHKGARSCEEHVDDRCTAPALGPRIQAKNRVRTGAV